MDRRFLETVARELGAGRSRRQVLGTATKGLLGGLGAAVVTGGTNRLGRPFATSVLAQDAAVEIRDFEFDPVDLEVAVGTKVTWTNSGPSPHTATSDDASTFDSGTLDLGMTFEHTFAAAGTFAYHCDFHPGMTAQIVVKEGSPTPTEPYIRRNVHTLPAGDRTLEHYATAVDKMKKLPITDPKSWLYQANIHQFPFEELPPEITTVDQLKNFLAAPGQEGWFTCEHSPTRFFWPWHRMYLYWFERIVRDMSGDPTFALPYWDYSDPANRVLPAPFRSELDEDGNPNPLFVDLRDPKVNQGIAPCFDTANPTCYKGVTEDALFDHCPGFAEDNNFDLASGILEGTPHGGVHNWVGGLYADPPMPTIGLMVQLTTSARDPIFWLHHANIDRLWESWLQLGTTAHPHDNPPTTDTSWHDNDVNNNHLDPPPDDIGFPIPYNFFDEVGTKVTTVRVVKNVVRLADLGYSYEELFDPVKAKCTTSGGEAVSATPLATPAAPEELGSNTPAGGIVAGPDPGFVSVKLTQPEAGPEAVAGGGTVVVTLEGVMGQGVPATSFEVYVNLPEKETADPNSIYFVGYLDLFGLQPWDKTLLGTQHHGVRRFNISRNVAALKASGHWTPDLTLTIVPRYGPSAQPEAAGASPVPLPSGPWVMVESITVTTQ